MPNEQDLLEIIDAHFRRSHGEVGNGWDFFAIATEGGISDQDKVQVPRWIGRLVEDGYLQHAPVGGPRPMPPHGMAWNEGVMQRANGYRLTAEGRSRADAIRRQSRESASDVTLGRFYPVLSADWLTDLQRRGLSRCVIKLRDALDRGEPLNAIGDAKELVEVAARIVVERHGVPITSNRDDLPGLFKAAVLTIVDDVDPVGKRLSAVVQSLVESRNETQAQHGGMPVKPPTMGEAHLASGAAAAIATFLLTGRGD